MDARSPNSLRPHHGAAAPVRSREASAAGACRVEIRTGAEMQPHVKAWRLLAERALEPNVFADPDVLLPGIKHLAEARRIAFLLVWRDEALAGLIPILPPRLRLARGRFALWRSPALSFGVPLVDREAPHEILECVLGFLAAQGARSARMVFPQVPETGPFAAALQAVAERTGRTLTRLDAQDRVVLADGWRTLDVGADGHHRAIMDELWRKRREMSDLGPVSIDQAREPRQVRDAVEEFLILEASGRKARSGAATIQDPSSAILLRIMTRTLARARHLRVDVLRVGDRPVAAAIVLADAHRAWVWKTVEDEAFAPYAAGAQLALEIARGHLERPRLDLVEPCAALGDPTGDPMLATLWRERVRVSDHLVTVAPRRAAAASPRTSAGAGATALAASLLALKSFLARLAPSRHPGRPRHVSGRIDRALTGRGRGRPEPSAFPSGWSRLEAAQRAQAVTPRRAVVAE